MRESSSSLWEVNALKISAFGTDLVGTSFWCHLHGTDFQYHFFSTLIFSTSSLLALISSTTFYADTDFQSIEFAGTEFWYHFFATLIFSTSS